MASFSTSWPSMVGANELTILQSEDAVFLLDLRAALRVLADISLSSTRRTTLSKSPPLKLTVTHLFGSLNATRNLPDGVEKRPA